MNFGGAFLQNIVDERSANSREISDAELSARNIANKQALPPLNSGNVLFQSEFESLSNIPADDEEDEELTQAKGERERIIVRTMFYVFAFIGILFLIFALIFGLGFGPGVQTAIWTITSIFLGMALALNTRLPREKRDPYVGIAGILITLTSFAAMVFFIVGLTNPDLDKVTMGLGVFETFFGTLLAGLWTYNVWFPNQKLFRMSLKKTANTEVKRNLANVEAGTSENSKRLHAAMNVVTILMWYVLAFLLIFFTYDIRGLVFDRYEFMPPGGEQIGIGDLPLPPLPFLPTSAPTASPTTMPTALPTLLPTALPTELPTTLTPTVFIAPTASPTSSIPSKSPSRVPTSSVPSGVPSRGPTSSAPSISPSSSSPTKAPSRSPSSSSPSYAPSSSSPSKVPSSSSPSKTPSRTPSTSSPSFTPTTSTPSKSPSLAPSSSVPSRAPSTSTPSQVPSANPTTTTGSPTLPPSTGAPTTVGPTSLPSVVPSQAPSSSSPSNTPSSAPGVSMPSVAPINSAPSTSPSSSSPSKMPSAAPLVSAPSKLPTLAPSLATDEPSAVPSASPSTPTTLAPTPECVPGVVTCCFAMSSRLTEMYVDGESVVALADEVFVSPDNSTASYVIEFAEPNDDAALAIKGVASFSPFKAGLQLRCSCTRVESQWNFETSISSADPWTVVKANSSDPNSDRFPNKWFDNLYETEVAATLFSSSVQLNLTGTTSECGDVSQVASLGRANNSFGFFGFRRFINQTAKCGEEEEPPIVPGTLHMVCTGNPEAQPIVLLEHDVSSTLDMWWWIQSFVANESNPDNTYVCAYSRRGYGYSFPRGELPRTPKKATKELMEALVAKLDNPLGNRFILVGHGLGGHHIRHFYNEYSRNISGMIFIDSRNADCEELCEEKRKKRDDRGFDFLRRIIPFGFARAAASLGSFPGEMAEQCVHQLPDVVEEPPHRGGRKHECKRRLISDLLNPEFWETSFDEDTESPETCNLMRNTRGARFREKIDVPVDVIVANAGLYRHKLNCGHSLKELGGGRRARKTSKEFFTNHYDLLCNQTVAREVAQRILDMVHTVREEDKTIQVRSLVKYSFDDAVSYCESIGAKLATIKSEQNMDDVVEYMKKVRGKRKAWIGLKKSGSSDPFKWIVDGTEVDSSIIEQGGSGSSWKDCAYVKSEEKFYPSYCWSKRHALCEFRTFGGV